MAKSSNTEVDDVSIFKKLAHQRSLFLKDDVDNESAVELVANFLWLDSLSQKEITLYINSRGGDVSDGLLSIYDVMQFISSPVKTICIGEAFSSAAILLAAGTPGLRYCSNNSSIMIHGLQIYELSGSYKDLEQEINRSSKTNNLLMEILSKHTNRSVDLIKQDCVKDNYLTATEAVAYGLVDHILPKNKSAKQYFKKIT